MQHHTHCGHLIITHLHDFVRCEHTSSPPIIPVLTDSALHLERDNQHTVNQLFSPNPPPVTR